MSALPPFFTDYQALVAQELQRIVPDRGTAVERSMAYTALASSKQVRAVLVMLCAELCRGQAARAVPAAAAIELVHASSLILDDLPSMDDAPLRRGRPANHREFGEATAILAAFGLLNLAYGTIARAYEPALAARMSALISDAVGPEGLIGGQALDLEATDQAIGFEMLERIHRGKTGALFVAAAAVGGMLANIHPAPLQRIEVFAKNLGLAFQITDDILDVVGNPDHLGKDVGKDEQKLTFVKLAGVDGAKKLSVELVETSIASIANLGPAAAPLRELAVMVRDRVR